ncbi:hypothetical protein Glove_242g176 [Diversispora epigaea]|uniref:Uncharacterized protein n=1 Tax=Diversispora epigaea TaxID=1348612 RepID=A0A397IIN1_9GLOM|nr:hypothetical protein Glove_242g176 [Diversispora epigaea]
MATAIKELSQTTLSIWKLLGGREKSANELIAQISNYSLKSKPYDFEFVTKIHTELSDKRFEDAVTKTTFPFDDEIFENKNDDESENDQFENDNELENNQFENNKVLEVEVTVEIPLSTEYTDSDEQDFNIESIINKSLERETGTVKNIKLINNDMRSRGWTDRHFLQRALVCLYSHVTIDILYHVGGQTDIFYKELYITISNKKTRTSSPDNNREQSIESVNFFLNHNFIFSKSSIYEIENELENNTKNKLEKNVDLETEQINNINFNIDSSDAL